MRRICAAAALALLAFATAATAAHAHGGGGTDYTAEIRAVVPAGAGLSVDVLERDDRLALRNDSGKRVVVEERKTKVFDWEVPIRVGGRQGGVTGTLTWNGRPDDGFPKGAAIALAAVVVAGSLLVVVVRRRRRSHGNAAGVKDAW